MKKISRRLFLDSGKKMITLIPLINVMGCFQNQSEKINPEDSLKKLILVIGPWTREEQSKAEEFANRFVKADPVVSQFLPEFSELMQSLGTHFSNNDFALPEINFEEFSVEERELLLSLSRVLYDFVEVRFYVSEIPPWGQCIGDPNWHTNAPM